VQRVLGKVLHVGDSRRRDEPSQEAKDRLAPAAEVEGENGED
jgi:hypothetical protein